MTSLTDPYADIRPYGDDEIPTALNRLIHDEEFINAILHYRFADYASWFKALMSPILRVYLKIKWSKLTSVESIQIEVKKYLRDTLAKTTDGVTYTGVESLESDQAYLFISNHRDIAMDPALVNYALHHYNHRTCRIAIGDNLLKKPCAAELMRLNKSFIVKRSLKGPREMMKVLGQLSSYIKHSLETGNSIWIAQKEGRAKDGNDFTEPAILKMFHVEGRKQKITFPEYVKSLKIVPVSISYENDPCDTAKAIELFEKNVNGSYEKGEFEDIQSIIQGIIGNKGRVHVGFGQVIDQNFDTPEALAQEIDRQIHENYKLFPVNLLAAKKEDQSVTEAVKQEFDKKLSSLPKGARQYLIDSYANPVKNKS